MDPTETRALIKFAERQYAPRGIVLVPERKGDQRGVRGHLSRARSPYRDPPP